MHIVIIGNGISGITAARWVRKLSDHKITVISKETDYFFSRTALMYIYMGHMRFVDTQPYEKGFWKKNRIELLRATVDAINYDDKVLSLSHISTTDHSAAPSTMKYDKLVLALGSEPNKFGWPGQDLERVQHLYSYQDLEMLEKNTPGMKRAVIVGGGLIGIELAEMLHTRHIPVSLLREKEYWSNALPMEEAAMVSQHILDHGIDLRKETELKEIIGDENGKAIGILTNKGEKIDCQLVGLTAGVHPNINFLKRWSSGASTGHFSRRFLANQPARCICHWRLCAIEKSKRGTARNRSGLVYRPNDGRGGSI